jgi:hypothetical protein
LAAKQIGKILLVLATLVIRTKVIKQVSSQKECRIAQPIMNLQTIAS